MIPLTTVLEISKGAY